VSNAIYRWRVKQRKEGKPASWAAREKSRSEELREEQRKAAMVSVKVGSQHLEQTRLSSCRGGGACCQ
jgi:hypothetical protein